MHLILRLIFTLHWQFTYPQATEHKLQTTIRTNQMLANT